MDKMESGRYKIVAKGQIILKEGQVNTVAYMVKKGSVRLCKEVNNRKVEVARITPGQIFGEMPLVTGDPFYATAEAAEQCQLIPFDQNFIQSLILKSPAPIQRIMRNMMEQLATLFDMVQAQPADDLFLSVCKILELLCSRTQGAPSGTGAKNSLQFSTCYSEFFAAVKDILIISQLEIDTVLEKLHRVNLIQVRDIKGALHKQDNTHTEFLRERILVITDKDSFLSSARNLRREMLTQEEQPRTQGLAFMDIRDFAATAQTDPDRIYRLLAQGRIPERLFFFPGQETKEWLETLEDDFFETTPAAANISDLKIIDDIVSVDAPSLQQAFHQLGQEKLIVLYAVAGERTKNIILACLSQKTAKIVLKESALLRVPYRTVIQDEKDFFTLLRRIKQNS